ncbi:hypothetical protein FACS1894105_10420 [Clostridia bacterium]|nr:hypothetical protein FACS1894105_10420 [Clostridia bacterium]
MESGKKKASGMDEPVIFTDGFFHRPRINDLIERAVSHPLVILVAGTGYGKTKSVENFISSSSANVTWTYLTPDNNDPLRFWENFCKAVAKEEPEIARRQIEFGFPDTDAKFERFVGVPDSELRNDVKYYMIFDDFQEITNREVLNYIEKSVRTPFPNIVTFLISRSEPDIDISDMLVKNQVSIIDENHLRFTQEEIQQYFNEKEIVLTKISYSDIYKNTDGWPLAVNLLFTCLKRGDMSEKQAMHSMNTNISRFVEHEFIAQMKPNVLCFLIKLSLLEGLYSKLVEIIAGNASLLEEIVAENSFVRFNTRQDAYHIHPLVLPILKKKQNQISEEDKRNVMSIAADWCAESDMVIEAVKYYAELGNCGGVLRVMTKLPLMLEKNAAEFYLGVIDKLFAEAENNSHNQDQSLDLLYLKYNMRIGMLIDAGEYETARRDILQACAYMEPRVKEQPMYIAALISLYNSFGFSGYLTCAEEQDVDFAAPFAKALAYYNTIPKEQRETKPYLIDGFPDYVNPIWIGISSTDAERVINSIELMESCVSKILCGTFKGISALARCEYMFYRGKYEDARCHALRAMTTSNEANQYEIHLIAMCYLCKIAIHVGDFTAALEMTGKLDETLSTKNYHRNQFYFDIFLGMLFAHIGLNMLIPTWLKSDTSVISEKTYAQMALKIRVINYLYNNRAKDALSVIDAELDSERSTKKHLFGFIELTILRAAALSHLGRTNDATSELIKAYEASKECGVEAPFVELGGISKHLFSDALKTSRGIIPAEWIKSMTAKTNAYKKKKQTIAKHYKNKFNIDESVHLSQREKEILTDTYHGLTRAEIAATRGISVNTIKTVLQMVYSKLGAANNVDAVRIAKERELI